jgi:ATP-dependent protease ClpP protease subunit
MKISKSRKKKAISNTLHTIKRKRLMKYVNTKNEEVDSDDDDSDYENSEGNGFSFLFGDNTVYDCDNHIYFRTDVNLKSIDKLVKIIQRKNDEFEEIQSNRMIKKIKPQPLYLHISSMGGKVFSAMIGVDAIINSKIPVYTIIEGYAASAATLLSVVGKKRYMTKNSYVLIHQISSGMAGKYNELVDDHMNNVKIMEHIKQIYKERTNMTDEKLDEYLSHDIWWGIEDAIHQGLVDKVF